MTDMVDHRHQEGKGEICPLRTVSRTTFVETLFRAITRPSHTSRHTHASIIGEAQPGADDEHNTARKFSASASGDLPPPRGTYWSAPDRNAAVGTPTMCPRRRRLSSEVKSALNMSSSPSYKSRKLFSYLHGCVHG